jgi:hypothetical protein
MSSIAFGPSGLPVQLTPVLPQTPPPTLLQAPPPQPSIAVAPAEQQPAGNAAKDATGRRDNPSPPPTGGRARLVDIKA